MIRFRAVWLPLCCPKPFFLSLQNGYYKMAIIKIDGIKTNLKPLDLDGDGQTGGIEVISRNVGVKNIIQQTELGESLKELNLDDVEPNTRMSGIDMRARLHHVEVASVLALDCLVALGVCPIMCLSVTRQKKRLSVSIDGKGRDDIVNIVSGKKEIDARSQGFGEKIKSFLGMGGKPEQ